MLPKLLHGSGHDDESGPPLATLRACLAKSFGEEIRNELENCLSRSHHDADSNSLKSEFNSGSLSR